MPLLGAIARCHCSVPWWGQGVVPLQGAVEVCYGWGGIFLYIDNTKIGFCYLGSMLV